MKKQQNTRESTKESTEIYPASESQKKKFFLRQTFFTLNHALRIALAIYLISQIASTDIQPFKKTSQYSRLQQITQLWKKNAIVDIITVQTYNCPEGYEIFTSAVWPGTRQGCFCSTKLGVYDYFHTIPGACYGKLIDAGCTQIQPQKSVPFIFWITDKLICVKRINGLNFYSNLTSINETKKCAEGKQYEFESLNISQCPLSNMKNTTQLSNIINQTNFSFDRQNGYPMIDLKVTEFNFCPQYNKSNISPNRFQNYVLEIIEIQHCAGSDPRVEEIDSMTEEEAFANNQRVLDVVTELPGFPDPSPDYIYKLGITRFPPWKYSCRSTEQFSLTVTKNRFSLQEEITSGQVTIALVIMIAAIWGCIYSIIFFILNLVQIRYKWKNKILFLNDHQIMEIDPNLLSGGLQLSIGGQLCLFVSLLITSLVTAIIIGAQYNSLSQIELWFRNSQECTGQTTYFIEYLNSYQIFLQSIIRILLVCILITVSIACIDILFFIWRVNKGDLSSQNLADIFKSQEKEQDVKELSKMQENNDVVTEKDFMVRIPKRKGTLVTEESQIDLRDFQSEQMTEDLKMSLPYQPVQKSRKLKKNKIKTIDLQFQ